MNRIAFVLDQFELQSPGQQLLDRFLIGFKHAGEFKPAPAKVVLSLAGARDQRLVESRVREFGLEVADSIDAAVRSADAVVIAPGGRNELPASAGEMWPEFIAHIPAEKRIYIDAAVLLRLSESVLEGLRQSRGPVISSRAAAHFIPLPVRPPVPGNPRKALIVAQGAFPVAELDALYALSSYLPAPALTGAAPRLKSLKSGDLWATAYSPGWRGLLEAAVSRSDNIKGDPDRDGRTQDIVGLQLIERLAPEARGWLLEHARGLQTLVLIVNGALGDFNIAFEYGRGVHSAQLYHPQPPMENHYDDLAAWILPRLADPSGNVSRALFITDLVRSMQS